MDPSPTKQLALALGEEREGGRMGINSSSSSSGSGSSSGGTLTTTSTNLSMQASGKLMVRQAQDLVRKWRLKLQVLPSLNQRFRDATAQTIHTFETKLSQMTDRLSTQEQQVQDAYKKVETLRATRTEAEEAHTREVSRAKRNVQMEYQELLAQVTAEKNTLAARLARLQAEVVVDVQEAREAGREEGREEGGKLEVLKEEVALWRKRCEEEAEGRARVGQEKEVVMGEKRRVQVEMDRLLRQLRYRDDVIAVFKETLEAHGLDELPQIGAQLALLQRHMDKSAREGGREGGGGGGVVGGDVDQGRDGACSSAFDDGGRDPGVGDKGAAEEGGGIKGVWRGGHGVGGHDARDAAAATAAAGGTRRRRGGRRRSSGLEASGGERPRGQDPAWAVPGPATLASTCHPSLPPSLPHHQPFLLHGGGRG
mgnify:CR=1 FL=1